MNQPNPEFQVREDAYHDRDCREFKGDATELYVCALQSCRPWGISHVLSGYFHVHTFAFGMSCVALFPRESDAEGYRKNMGMGDQWEVRQWEGRDDD